MLKSYILYPFTKIRIFYTKKTGSKININNPSRNKDTKISQVNNSNPKPPQSPPPSSQVNKASLSLKTEKIEESISKNNLKFNGSLQGISKSTKLEDIQNQVSKISKNLSIPTLNLPIEPINRLSSVPLEKGAEMGSKNGQIKIQPPFESLITKDVSIRGTNNLGKNGKFTDIFKNTDNTIKTTLPNISLFGNIPKPEINGEIKSKIPITSGTIKVIKGTEGVQEETRYSISDKSENKLKNIKSRGFKTAVKQVGSKIYKMESIFDYDEDGDNKMFKDVNLKKSNGSLQTLMIKGKSQDYYLGLVNSSGYWNRNSRNVTSLKIKNT